MGGPGGVKRGLLYPQRALLSPLEVLYGTKFGSKHHIIDRMANVYKVCITLTHFWTFEPPWEPPKGRFMSKTSRFQAPNSLEYGLLAPEMVIRWPKLSKFCPKYPILVFWTNLGHLVTISGAKKPCSRLFGALKRLVLLMKRPFGGTQGGPKGPKMGQ